jgi:peptide/nickel transport system ATP-binding protein
MSDSILHVRDLVVEARSQSGVIHAVDHVDFAIAPSEIVGLIGESGSGKTTLVRSMLDLHERNVSIIGGSVEFNGTVVTDIDKGISAVDTIRGSHVAMVFQSPRASLDPLMTIGSHLREVLKRHKPDLSRAEVRQRSLEVLGEMGLDAERVIRAYPHQLSGGMCQRAAIAVAISTYPEMLIADECTSALDVTSQEEVVEVLKQLTASRKMALVFVTHDMLLASELCDRLVVMKSGKVVESGPTTEILANPREEYTKKLISAVPRWVSGAAQ